MKIASRFALLAAVSLLLVACAGGGTSWTFSAPAATSPAASGESPGASGSPGESPASPLPSGPSASGGQSAAPSGSAGASPSGSAGASPGGSPGASASAGGDVIDLEATATLQWAQNGQPIANLTVPAGRPVTFRVNNVAGFDHNFWIGDPAALSQNDTSNATGIDTWQTGVRETQYTFQAGQTLEFACTVPGHYPSMHGSFTIQP